MGLSAVGVATARTWSYLAERSELMAAEPLASACEIAFDVAKKGAEANPPLPVPAAMRSFLYVPQLPRRAMTVARRVIDEDPNFRARVAAAAPEAKVGRAGYLWLHRPYGWEHEFAELTGTTVSPTASPTYTDAAAPIPAPTRSRMVPENPGASMSGTPAPPPVPPEERGAPPTSQATVSSPATASGVSATTPPAPRHRSDLSRSGRGSGRPSGAASADRESIEAELSSLRELVDRLGDERRNVDSSVDSLETEVVERRAESRSLTGQLDAAGRDISGLRAERDAALEASRAAESERQEAELRAERMSARVVDLERELVQMRNRSRSEAEARDENEVAANNLRTEVATLQQRVTQLDDARAQAIARSERAEQDRQTAMASMHALQAERDQARDRLRVADQGRADLEAELADVSGRWHRLQLELRQLGEQRAAIENELDQLNQSRRASQAERRALFHELASQLGRVEAERDLLAGQLDLARARLSGTRKALDASTRAISGELDGAEAAFGETSRAARAIDDAVADASVRLYNLGQVIADRLVEPPPDNSRSAHAPAASEPDDDQGASDRHATDVAAAPAVPADLEVEVEAEAEGPQDDDLSYAVAAAVDRVSEPDEDDAWSYDAASSTDVDLDATFHLAESEPGFTDAEPLVDAVAVDDLPAQPRSAESVDLDIVSLGTSPMGSPGRRSEPSSFAGSLATAGEGVGSGLLGSEVSSGAASMDADLDLSPIGAPPSPPDPDDVLASYGLGADALQPPPAPPVSEMHSNAPVPPPPSPASLRTRVAPFDGTPLEYAHHVMATADVIAVIDGDPVAEMGWPGFSVDERRSALVQNLAELVAETGAAPDVLFDADRGRDLPPALVGRMRVREPGVTMHDAIITMLDSYPMQWPVAVVTDDSQVAAEARSRGAAVLNSGQVLDLFV